MYETLGQAEGPNVAWKSILAFVVPILVFIGALTGFGKALALIFDGKLLIGASFLLAFFVSFLVVVFIWAVRRFTSSRHCEKR